MNFDLFAASLWESKVTPCLPRIRDPEEACNYVPVPLDAAITFE